MIEELLSHQLSDAQESFLRRSTLGITLAAILFVAPFAIHNLFQGYWLLALSAGFILCVISYTAWNTLAGRLSYKLSFVFLTPAMMLFFWFSIRDQGVIGVLWSFPAVIMFYFILPERLARIANIMLLLVVIPQAFMILDNDVALRTMATISGVSIFCLIFVRRLNAQQLELEEQAATDPLTRLGNRLHFDKSLNSAVQYSLSRGYPLSVLSIDLDNFRRVNESYGYETGNRVLEAFGRLLTEKTYGTDELFRLGGEEFLIVLNGSNSQAAEKVAEKIHLGLAENQSLKEANLSASIGIATFDTAEDRHELLNRADQNLHRAKAEGGNTTKV